MVTTTGRRVTAITSRNGYERAGEFINAVPPIEQVLEPVKTAEVRRLMKQITIARVTNTGTA